MRAWHQTYGLPVLITNCSNNYGPCQFPEKLIPLMIHQCARRQPMPVYGDGENIRDWLFVDDHARHLTAILRDGQIGECYNVGGHNEMRNIDVATMICDLVDEMAPPLGGGKPRRELITFVPTGRATTSAMPSMRARSAKSSIGGRTKPSPAGCARRWPGIWRTRTGGPRCEQSQQSGLASQDRNRCRGRVN